jgi:quinoprotein glucose dehydrogenase
MDRDLSRLQYGVTSAPGVFENLVILGFSVGEGPGVTAPGDVRAFDVRTGKEMWRFHTVPRPGEFGSETWRESSWKERGGANAWSGVSIDARRGIVFAALGAPAFDFVRWRPQGAQSVRQLCPCSGRPHGQNGCGTSRRCDTICGTMTTRAHLLL